MPKTDPPRVVSRPGLVDLPEEPRTNPRIKRERKRTDLKLIGVAVVSISTAFGAYRVVLSEAAAQTDAGVRVLSAELRGHESRLTTSEKRVDRMDDKLDLLLDAARVPQWKRPPPLDGGQ